MECNIIVTVIRYLITFTCAVKSVCDLMTNHRTQSSIADRSDKANDTIPR